MQSVKTYTPGSNKSRNLHFYTIIGLRTLLFALIIISLDRAIGIGTSPVTLFLGAFAGTLAASYFALSKLNTSGSLLLLLIFLALFYLATAAADLVTAFLSSQIFSFYIISFHSELLVFFFAIAYISAWFFWRSRSSVTVEILLLAALAIYLLSGHRNYHLDMPRMVNSLAWSFGVDYLAMLIILGVSVSSIVLLYLYFSSFKFSVLAASSNAPLQSYSNGGSRRVASLSMLIVMGVFIYFVATQVYSFHHDTAAIRTAHGVGQDNTEELSPLEFHSALGSTNQPAALVRLESDYTQNPFSPMLYLRESVLSGFNGREMVIAPRVRNTDISYTNPDEVYEGAEDKDLRNRQQVVQSIHLLSNHKSAFAIDYPTRIRQLTNPNPGRFRKSYRAYSLAPGYTKEELIQSSVGDPRWSQSDLEHFLVEHPDPRYRELALRIASPSSSSVEKAYAVIDYLSRNSIYTLTPNHETAPGDDPVEPYIFGDMRGYCVHFAHATVYILRALRIPSRIATGYLTDLSQARDGHVLLRMSDRHAWAEVYIEGKGWVPFDTHPDQVESHADTDIDVDLLEELMSMLGPDEEILPPEAWSGEDNLYEGSAISLPDKKFIVLPAAFILTLVVLAKLFLLFGWALPGSAEARIRRTYLAILSMLFDLGLKRRESETRIEFEKRVSDTLQIGAAQTTQLINRIIYSEGSKGSLDEHAYRVSKAELSAFSSLSPLQKLRIALNPFSALLFLLRQKW